MGELSNEENNEISEKMTLSPSAKVISITTFEMNEKQFLASAGYGSNDIEVWNLANSSEIDFILTGHVSNVYALKSYEKNGKVFLVSGSWDEFIKLWDMSTKKCVNTL